MEFDTLDKRLAQTFDIPLKHYSTNYHNAKELVQAAQRAKVPIALRERANGTIEICTSEQWGIEVVKGGLTAQEAPRIICSAIVEFIRKREGK